VGLRHRGKAVPLADHCGTLLGVPSAVKRGRWLVGRALLASLDTLWSSWWCTWWGAGAVATLLGWVRVAVAVVVGLVRMPKGRLSCGGPPVSRPACSSSLLYGCGLDLANGTFGWCG
jgi:hypothetical protein